MTNAPITAQGSSFYSATFTLINSWVYSNPADHEVDYWLLGGGLATRDADAVIRDVHFHDNEARWGGGLALYGGQTQVENIVLSSNVGYWGGGGWFCNNAVVVKMSRSVLTDNEAQEGGGLFTCSSEVQITLEGNVFSGNHAEEGGGLAIKYGSDITLINNVIRENQADSSGAGFYADGGSSRLLHSTFVGNYGGDGSGIHLDGGRVAMTNTILVSHTVGISVAENSSADLEATLWGSGDSANDADWLGAGTILTGEINLWATPAFAPDGYHLTADSAAINNGIDAGVTTDIDGDPRPFVSLFDLGADEFITSRLFLPLLMR